MTIWLPDGPQTVGRSPEVSREWPVNSPGHPSSSAQPQPDRTTPLAVALVVLGALVISLIAGLAPLKAVAAALFAGAVALPVADRLARAPRDPARVLARAQDALLFGEDARRVLRRCVPW